MKTSRLIGILTLLLERDKMTAPELAAHFEVSRRTINRDIEDLCLAGIPLVTRQGSGGGISIQEGYKINAALLTQSERDTLLAGLKGLGSVSPDDQISLLLSKLKGRHESERIHIDLASHYKAGLTDKISLINQAMEEGRSVCFTYYGKTGKSERCVDPVLIAYRWADWYLRAYCHDRDDYRMFKLNRMTKTALGKVMHTGRQADPSAKPLPAVQESWDDHLTEEHSLEVLFEKECAYRLVESYGAGSFTEQTDGRLHFKGRYTNREYILSWLLGFGDSARILQPAELAEDIKKIALKIITRYET